MKYDGILLVVEDMERSKRFYMGLLGFEIAMDLGENVSFKEGLFLQTKSSWSKFAGIPIDEFKFGGRDKELVFTDNDLDGLSKKLEKAGVKYKKNEMPWMQRTISFFDPDAHVIGVGEAMDHVAARLLKDGMPKEKVSEVTMIPMEYINTIIENMGP